MPLHSRVLPLLLVAVLSGYAQQKPRLLKPAEIHYEGKDIKTAWVAHAPGGASADAFIRWPAGVMEDGKTEPTSTHPFSVRIVVIAGTVLFQFEGGEMQELTSGSYILAPARVKHSFGCKAAGPECIVFAVFEPDPAPPK